MSRTLLFEIGTEELPAGEIDAALSFMQHFFRTRAVEARLAHGDVLVAGTPRRLALLVHDVAERGEDRVEEVLGPAARAAFDADGRPTRAAEGFARGKGIDVSALYRTSTPKGDYVAARIESRGADATDILPGLLADMVPAIPWKRSMRWAWSEVSFARPIHWFVALFGTEVLPMAWAGIDAGRTTRGHRFLGNQPAVLERADDYIGRLRALHVLVDIDERRACIRDGVRDAVLAAGLRPIEDDALVDEVVHLVEWPVPLLGRFDEALLEVPREVLITSMRSHQRYFAAERADGTLANAFCFVSNMVVPDPDVVIAGNRRVLLARLEDARFFYREDRKRRLEDRVADLGRVVFIDRLGSVLDRVDRIEALSSRIAALLHPGDDRAITAARRAARLAKADLTTGMVGEFPELQGIMGRYYALADGETADIADAVRDHYLPRSSDDAPPTSRIGIIVALADKLDLLVGCFALGLVPTGSADPYALRRAALGVIRTATRNGLVFQLRALLADAVDGLPSGLRPRDEVLRDVAEFILARLRANLAADHAADIADAVVAVSEDDLPSAPARAQALADLRANADFVPLAVAFRRVVNILTQAAEAGTTDHGDFDDALAEHDAERALAAALRDAEPTLAASAAEADFVRMARTLIALKPAIDAFFDGVLVNAPDPAVRRNRLALLHRIRLAFSRFADISRVQAG